MVTVVTVDDTNTVQLKYDNKWFHGNWTDTSTQPPSNRSLLSSNDVTAQMVLVFPVVGTGISYYGMRRSGGGSYRICIDCDPNQPAGPFDTIDALNTTDNGQNPPVLLYSKQGLSNDMHTVVLMNTNDTRVHPQGASQITLDRFEITTQDPPVVTVIGTATSTNTATGTIVPIETSPGDSVNSGLIAGVVIGALGVLALLVGLFLCWRRKRRIAVIASIEDGRRPRDESSPRPLNIRRLQDRLRSNTSRPTLHPMSSSNTLATLNAKRSESSFSAVHSGVAQTVPPVHLHSEAPVSASSSPVVAPTSSSLVTNRRTETDAGPVHEDTLPPDYAQVFNSQPALEPTAGVSSDVPSSRPQQNRKRS